MWCKENVDIRKDNYIKLYSKVNISIKENISCEFNK